MKYVGIAAGITLVLAGFVLMIWGFSQQIEGPDPLPPEGWVKSLGPVYDANDPIYQFIPIPPANWVESFGDNERSRVLHSVSELRLVLATMGRTIITLEAEVQELKAIMAGPEVEE